MKFDAIRLKLRYSKYTQIKLVGLLNPWIKKKKRFWYECRARWIFQCDFTIEALHAFIFVWIFFCLLFFFLFRFVRSFVHFFSITHSLFYLTYKKPDQNDIVILCVLFSLVIIHLMCVCVFIVCIWASQTTQLFLLLQERWSDEYFFFCYCVKTNSF